MMSGINQETVCNRILLSLSERAFSTVAQHLEPLSLPCRRKLADPRSRVEWIYFPESGVASVIGHIGGTAQEVAMFGRDGVGCISGILAPKPAPYLVVMQLAGHGFRIPADILSHLVRTDDEVQDVILRFLRAGGYQVAQNALANTQLNTAQRLARWLLMVRDRIDADAVTITHENLAYTLGVGRTSVTLALRALVDAELIATTRGTVTLLDEPGLKALSGASYGLAEAEYDRLFQAPVGHDEPAGQYAEP